MNRRFLQGVALLSCFLIVLVFTSCASQPNTPVANTDFKGPTLKAVRDNPARFIGQQVRWGGSIARVENRRNETIVEIVQHPLLENGRPRSVTVSAGRFVTRIGGFLDPVIYAKNRQLTVVGTLEPSIERNIGDYPYRYPVVAADMHQLWGGLQDSRVIYYYPDPFWGFRRHRWGWHPPTYY